MRVSLGDRRVFFDVDGLKLVPDGARLRERPTVILVHGGPGFDHSSFKPDYGRLSEVAQVIYPDLRGHGRSDEAPASELSLARWADDVAEFCRALDIDKPVIYGLSFGGFIAQAVAIRHPDLAPKIILDSTVPRIRLELSYAAFEDRAGPEVRLIAERFWTDPKAPGAREEYLSRCLPVYSRRAADPDALARTILHLEILDLFFAPGGEGRTFDFRAGLGGTMSRFLVLSGLFDPITPPAAMAAFKESVPAERLQFVSFENAGHGVFRDSPEASFDVVSRFIAEE